MAGLGMLRAAAAGNQRNHDATYTFASLPRALLHHRSKNRDYAKGEEVVRRGGRSASRGVLGRSEPWAMTVRMIPDMAVSPELFRIKAGHSLTNGHVYKSRSRHHAACFPPPPAPHPAVPGRKHLHTQTETYLQELTSRKQELDAVCQTEEEEASPCAVSPWPSPLLPSTPCADAATQIDEDDLFDFEMECEPVVEQLIQVAVRRALMELAQEEEVADIHRQRRRFQQLRKAFLAGENVISQYDRKVLDERLSLVQSVHSWAYNTQPEVIKTDLERVFLPWILEEVEEELSRAKSSA